MRLTTAMTAATPMTTPIRVSTLRSLCAQRLPVAIPTASVRLIVDARAMSDEGTLVPHPNIRASVGRSFLRTRHFGACRQITIRMERTYCGDFTVRSRRLERALPTHFHAYAPQDRTAGSHSAPRRHELL